MTMKKTGLVKQLAKKLDGKMKSGVPPQRFAQGSKASAVTPGTKPAPVATKLVPVACRLPAALVQRLREGAAGVEGGMSVVMAQAVELWLLAHAPTHASTTPAHPA
jgi:hypothetical protein